MTATTRDGVVRAGLVALVEHMAEHQLSAPLAIDLPLHPDDAPFVRVRLGGVGQQSAWLDTVEVVDEVNGPGATDRYVATVWHVRLPDTLTRIQLTASRPVGLAAVTA
jgi:hypothetical protein